ncbi:hypothetical protein Q7C_1480 [Methylophaga frappieri]|uniref:Uncharacterized protein n=1 Tax=Methylophaga frappieri (strain ATCC BAA-2434 / DSM 25690 / JAM7) TaxID=754477 RepID=I1YI86_METFJ|nr:hypothetical protein [Methylophaga frappieri]AFJ02629.1 hypothetical protein Q7C_1480 [Methylophaga frappieri]
MTEEMMIDLNSIDLRLDDHRLEDAKEDLEIAIARFIEAIINQINSGEVRDIYSFEDSEAEKFINSYSVGLSKKLTSDFAKETLDSLRHAFVSFAFNGLHQLFTRQENEVWYPKIVLTKELIPNDKETLDEEFLIFRGCSKSELESGNFGQSWSTCENCATEFAFKHYASQDWFNPLDRIVLWATYYRENVLFSNQTDFGEYEVAVNTGLLDDVTQYK